jgi:hypothetical protein
VGPSLIRAIGDPHRWTEVEVDGIAMPVFVRLAQRDSGEIVCTGVIVGVKPRGTVVRAQDLRIPLAQVTTEIVSVWRVLESGVAGFLDPQQPRPVARVRRPRRRDRAFFEELARHYRAAMKLAEWRGAPTKYLREHDDAYRGVKDSTLRYWLHQARELKVLRRSEKGRPGEARRPRRKGSGR